MQKPEKEVLKELLIWQNSKENEMKKDLLREGNEQTKLNLKMTGDITI